MIDWLQKYREHVRALRASGGDRVAVFNPDALNRTFTDANEKDFYTAHLPMITKIMAERPLTLRGFNMDGSPNYNAATLAIAEIQRLSAEKDINYARINSLASAIYARTFEQYGLQTIAQHYGLKPEEAQKFQTSMGGYLHEQSVQINTNCYIAASGAVKKTSMVVDGFEHGHRPGQATRLWSVARLSPNLTAFNRQVHGGMLADGYQFVGQNPRPIPGHIMVARYGAKMKGKDGKAINDYHYVFETRSPEGHLMWAHKAGNTPATHLDHSGQVIADPKKANLGPYVFQGYYSRPIEGLKATVGRPDEVAINGSMPQAIDGAVLRMDGSLRTPAAKPINPAR